MSLCRCACVQLRVRAGVRGCAYVCVQVCVYVHACVHAVIQLGSVDTETKDIKDACVTE